MTETVCFRIEVPDGARDVLVAELHSLGTLGIEEGDEVWLAYFPADVGVAAVRALEDPALGIRVAPPEPVPQVDWSRRWREGLRPRVVGPLRIRPSWYEPGVGPEIELDPQQAFGSGEHASTRLCLQLLVESLQPGDRVLDLGTGSGILALAALRLGARRALGLDIDLAACRNAVENADRNHLDLEVVCGTPDSVTGSARFEISLANLLLGRLKPWLSALAERTERALIISGYLAGEQHDLEGCAVRYGLLLRERRQEAQSGDLWCASLWAHPRALQ